MSDYDRGYTDALRWVLDDNAYERDITELRRLVRDELDSNSATTVPSATIPCYAVGGTPCASPWCRCKQ